MSDPRPPLIGIGAQKCASSWLHAAMGAHPEVAVSNPKELDFFSYHYDRGYRWYQGFFGHARPGQIWFEASPSYLHDPRTPARVAAWNPAARIVLLLRDPVARAWSNHLHEVIKGHIPRLTFAEGLANNPAYVEQGLYATHLRRWLGHVPRDQVLVLLAEEIGADPEAAARAVCRFAGLREDFASAVLSERRNESDRARVPALRAALRAGGQGLRQLGLEEPLARLKKTGPVARMLAANSIDLKAKIAPMDAASRAHLTALFAPEVAALAPLIGRDSLPWPTWDAAR